MFQDQYAMHCSHEQEMSRRYNKIHKKIIIRYQDLYYKLLQTIADYCKTDTGYSHIYIFLF